MIPERKLRRSRDSRCGTATVRERAGFGLLLASFLLLAAGFTSVLAASPSGEATLPGSASAPPALELSLKQAVAIALEKDGNTKAMLAKELVRQVRAQWAQERAALLPHLESSASQQSRTTNLAAVGIQFTLPLPGFQPPQFVGPFDTFDARVRASQALLDLGAIRRFQASRVAVGEAQLQHESARDEVAGLVARQYLAVLRADARLQAAQSNIALAEAILELARDQKKAGTGTGIEVTRAEVQLANERQQLLVTQNERRRAQLELLRAMGLKLETEVQLTQTLADTPLSVDSLDKAVEAALASRADLQAQRKREEKLRLQSSAARWERAPSLQGFADYGSLGSSISRSLPTRSIGVSLTVPLFDGGRRDARRAEAHSRLEQEKIRSQDLREQIELDVRLALDALRSAEAQVKVANEGVGLAIAEFEQAQRRYRSGITTSVEVTDAQTRLERARENRIAALFQFNRAKIEIGQAMGTIRAMIDNGQLGD